VQYRIGASGEVPKQVQQMGLLLWKQYAEKNGLLEMLNDPDDDGDGEENVSFDDITSELIFANFVA